MLSDREIISTLEMLQNENLDVRTVTLGINLLDCASRDLNQLNERNGKDVNRSQHPHREQPKSLNHY